MHTGALPCMLTHMGPYTPAHCLTCRLIINHAHRPSAECANPSVMHTGALPCMLTQCHTLLTHLAADKAGAASFVDCIFAWMAFSIASATVGFEVRPLSFLRFVTALAGIVESPGSAGAQQTARGLHASLESVSSAHHTVHGCCAYIESSSGALHTAHG